MTTRDFKVFLEPDEDYGGYVVVCPSIPGCYSQGKTVSGRLCVSPFLLPLSRSFPHPVPISY
jgi:hypothetical protein